MVQRKGNPDYEPVQVMSKDGVKSTVYKRKGDPKPKTKNVGTPEKRRGGFKKPKGSNGNVGMLDSKPSNASSMAKPLGNINVVRSQSNAIQNLDNMNRLSGRSREALQGQKVSKKANAEIKNRSRPNPSSGGGDGRT